MDEEALGREAALIVEMAARRVRAEVGTIPSRTASVPCHPAEMAPVRGPEVECPNCGMLYPAVQFGIA